MHGTGIAIIRLIDVTSPPCRRDSIGTGPYIQGIPVNLLNGSQTLRVLGLGMLVLILQIPILKIGGLITERQLRSHAAAEEIASKWGSTQVATGPALVIPYLENRTGPIAPGGAPLNPVRQFAVFLPETLKVDGTLETDVRRRGIFSLPVYRLDLQVKGSIRRPDFDSLDIAAGAVNWEQAQLVMGISDVRAIRNPATLTWNGAQRDFLPGTAGFAEAGSGIHAAAPLTGTEANFDFEFALSLNGSNAVYFTPFARNTVIALRSNFAHPSFQGNWLPVDRSVQDTGFQALWMIPYLGRGYPQSWTSKAAHGAMVAASRFGVELSGQIDHYRMAERSIKYAALFMVLTFATVWLIEILTGIRAHPVQYLMLGAALCLFYLLELSLAEHLSFPVSYTIASVAVVTMASGYSLIMLRRPARAAVVSGGISALYFYLYFLLSNEDYALLVGSIGLFAALAVVMVVTRRVNWYSPVQMEAHGRRGA